MWNRVNFGFVLKLTVYILAPFAHAPFQSVVGHVGPLDMFYDSTNFKMVVV